MAGSVGVSKGAKASVISTLDASPYTQPLFPPSIKSKTDASERVLIRAMKYNNPELLSQTMPLQFSIASSEDRTESEGLFRASSASNIAQQSGSVHSRPREGWVDRALQPAQQMKAHASSRLVHRFDPIGHLESEHDSGNAGESDTEYPGSTAVSMGLLRVADSICRKLLPWQAVCCPCAVESFRDMRHQSITTQNNTFISRMTQQLEGKVLDFITRKDEEVDRWLQREADFWAKTINADDAGQNDFLVEEEMRIMQRSGLQERAARYRENSMAVLIDTHERDAAKDQLTTYRRLCRSDNSTSSGSDIRSLYSAMETAQSLLVNQKKVMVRDLTKRQEQAIGWLSCLGDNALAAVVCETALQELTLGLQNERARALDSLQCAITAYTEQHNAILEAITAFSGKVSQHAADFIRREQLVSTAFKQYLVSVVQNGIQPNTNEDKKKKLAWEGKLIVDRATKRDSLATTQFSLAMQPFEKKANVLKERLLMQLETVAMKMQSILNNRDRDINSRKAIIFKRLSKHVKHVCSQRRTHVKTSDSNRIEKYKLEERCIASIEELSAEVRSSMDQLWIKEHLREKRMYEASVGRTARLESSALLLWKRNAHMATREKEDYDMWIQSFTQGRTMMLGERALLFNKTFSLFRQRLMSQGELRGLQASIVSHITSFVRKARAYLRGDSSEVTESKSCGHADDVNEAISSIISVIANKSFAFRDEGIASASKYFTDLREELVKDWELNLNRLNKGIVRRVRNLKLMETELQETLKLSFAQNEVECVIFEQTSCAKFEHFWSAWGDRLIALSGELKSAANDFQITLAKKRIAQRMDQHDVALDILISGGSDPKESLKKSKRIGSAFDDHVDKKSKRGPGSEEHMEATLPSLVKLVSFSDTLDDRTSGAVGSSSSGRSQDERVSVASAALLLKILLDDLHPDVYISFRRQVTSQYCHYLNA